MLKIWGRRNSVNVKKVLWCAEEAGVASELTEAGMAFGLNNEPWFRALNPNGLVPLIRDGDVTLWESNAIVRYLAAKYAPGSLSAIDPGVRGQADKWMDWSVSAVAPAFRDVFWNLVRTAPEKRDMAAVAAGVERCGALFAIVDAELAQRPFLSGEDLGIGDIPLGCQAYGWFELPITRPDLPHFAAWYERLQARPAYRRTVAIGLT